MGLSIQEKFTIDFQDGNCGGNHVFPIRTILAVFDLQVISMILSFKLIGFSVQKKIRKIFFQDGRHGGHLGFSIAKTLAIFDLQVTLMIRTKF